MSQMNPERNDPAEAGSIVAQGLTNYGGLEPSVLASLAEHAERIRAAHMDVTQRVFAIGKELMLAKRWLNHGQFGPWLQAEFGWSERTAQRYMQAVEVFGPKADIVSVLEPTAIYALSSKSTPAAVREQLVSQLEAGEKPGLREVQTKVAEARKVERAEKAVMRVARDPRQPLPAATARRSVGRAQEVANFILERLGEDRERLAQLMKDVDPKALVEALCKGEVVHTTAPIRSVEI